MLGHWSLALKGHVTSYRCFENESQGRSQEETTTEANTRSVVRNQPYEIF